MDLKKNRLNQIKSFLIEPNLPFYKDIFEILDKASTILETEIKPYRVASSDNKPGCLISLTEAVIPLVIVPDLHARPYFLNNILNYTLGDGSTISQALCENRINLIFVGDILHTERNTKDRWLAIQDEFAQNIFTGPAISMEMQEGLSLLCGLLELKAAFPENCHILKGNHENILNVTANGDFSFKKYADEGEMCRKFIQEYYGDDILYMIHCVEKALPVAAIGLNCVVSHAEPKAIYSKDEIVNARNNPSVIEGLTWTTNDEAKDGSAIGIIRNLANSFDLNNIEDYVYIGGHRPVTGKFAERQNGKYIQIHNPSAQNIAIVYPDRKFNPSIDIVEVNK